MREEEDIIGGRADFGQTRKSSVFMLHHESSQRFEMHALKENVAEIFANVSWVTIARTVSFQIESNQTIKIFDSFHSTSLSTSACNHISWSAAGKMSKGIVSKHSKSLSARPEPWESRMISFAQKQNKTKQKRWWAVWRCQYDAHCYFRQKQARTAGFRCRTSHPRPAGKFRGQLQPTQNSISILNTGRRLIRGEKIEDLLSLPRFLCHSTW